jgi:hypothetical protein
MQGNHEWNEPAPVMFRALRQTPITFGTFGKCLLRR